MIEERVKKMKADGMTLDEIARRFNTNTTEINRILNPPPAYGNYTLEEKKRHRDAGLKRAQTLKKRRDEAMKKNLELIKARGY